MRMTETELRSIQQQSVRAALGAGAVPAKYRSQTVTVDGFNFDSKLEAEVFCMLKFMQLAGEVLYFLRQAPFHLPGNVTYRVDFVVFYRTGAVRYLDPKGVETPAFKRSRKQVQALYPVKIETVKKINGRLVGL